MGSARRIKDTGRTASELVRNSALLKNKYLYVFAENASLRKENQAKQSVKRNIWEITMPEKKIFKAEIVSNSEIADGIMKMTLSAPEAAKAARPGQFANLYPAADSLILPRPVSICDADPDAGTLTFVYAVVGAGTTEFAALGSGDFLRVSSPLGTGFTLPAPSGAQSNRALSNAEPSGASPVDAGAPDAPSADADEENHTSVALSAESAAEYEQSAPLHAVLIGGGVGTAPMLFLAKELGKRGIRCTAVTGFRKQPFLSEELKAAGAKVITTTDLPTESAFLGTVVDCMKINEIRGDLYFSCGPRPMLAAVSQYISTFGQDVQVSLEERMGCGYGACVGCVCDIKELQADGSEKLVRKKVCKDGPVFMGSEVVW